MTRKIITYFLILAVMLPVLASAVPLPVGSQALGVNVAHAEDTTEKTSSNSSISSPCELVTIKDTAGAVGKAATNIADPFNITGVQSLFRNSGGSVWNCVSYTIVNILYDFVMLVSIWITGLASDIFNASVSFSLTGEIFDADKNTMIKDGWTLVRDLLNLVFIFILLYAAISTILQYGGVDIKKILPMIIIAALLVNFSLMISKMVIDASHIFAFEFYNQIDATQKGEVADIKSSVEIKSDQYFKKKNLGNVFIAGFNPQRMLIEGGMMTSTEEGETEISPWEDVYRKAMSGAPNDEKSIFDTLWLMALIILLESALAIFSAFILLAGAIMFVIRVVVLWLVMIFSPLAFLGIILPSMKKYSGMWWSYLIGQSFFAPAFLFMFMLTTKLVSSKFMENLLSGAPNDDSLIVLGLSLGKIVIIFFNFLIFGVLMFACLVVARQLGGKTAEFGIGWAHKGKDLALGGALKYVHRPLLRHTVGSVSSGMAKSKWAERMAAGSPIIGGWMKGVLKKGGDVGGFDKIMEQRIKTGQSLSTPELRAQYLSNLSGREQAEWYKNASARTRVELEEAALKGGHVTALNNMIDVHKKLSLEEQEKTIKVRSEVDLKKSDKEVAAAFINRDFATQKEIISQIKSERKPGFVNMLADNHRATFDAMIKDKDPVTGDPTMFAKMLMKFRPDLIDTSTFAGAADMEKAVISHKAEEILLLDKRIVNNPEIMTEMVKNYKGGHVNKIIERGDELYEKFKDKLMSISGGSNRVSDVVSNLKRIGNDSLASLIQANGIMQKQLGLV